MRFSVIINTRNHPESLSRCLERLAAQDYPCTDWEIVVVDDGSEGSQTGEVARAFSGPAPCRLVTLPPSGRSAARNAGIGEARGGVALFLGDDIFVEPDWLSQHAAWQERHPGCAVVGGRRECTPTPSPVFLEWWDNLRFQDIADPEDASFAFFYTCNVSVSRAALLEAGGLDENFTRYGWEDLDLGLRLEKQGLKVVYAPEIVAEHHHPRATVEALCHREYEMGFTAPYFFAKWAFEEGVQAIPFWQEAKRLGKKSGPRWRRHLGRRLLEGAEKFPCPSSWKRLLYARVLWAFRAAGLGDGRHFYGSVPPDLAKSEPLKNNEATS